MSFSAIIPVASMAAANAALEAKGWGRLCLGFNQSTSTMLTSCSTPSQGNQTPALMADSLGRSAKQTAQEITSGTWRFRLGQGDGMRIALICLLLTGCAAFDPEPYNIKQDTVTVQVVINPMLTAFDYKGDIIHPQGMAERKDGKCVITLREYPICLAHEMRHCIEGQWHPKASKHFPGNDDDCWQDGQQQNLR